MQTAGNSSQTCLYVHNMLQWSSIIFHETHITIYDTWDRMCSLHYIDQMVASILWIQKGGSFDSRSKPLFERETTNWYYLKIIATNPLGTESSPRMHSTVKRNIKFAIEPTDNIKNHKSDRYQIIYSSVFFK